MEKPAILKDQRALDATREFLMVLSEWIAESNPDASDSVASIENALMELPATVAEL